MCGLVGALVADNKWNLNSSEIGTFNNLLYCSALRGADSTGVMVWDGKHVKMIKAAGHPADFLYSDLYRNFINEIKEIKMIFGHTRLATVGKINSKNAHPFRTGKIMLMHNGNVQSVPGEVIKEHEVDSLALAVSLSKNPAETVFESFDGAAACIWFDMETKKLNLYRNFQRPLSMTESTITNYLASEGDMLKWVLGRGHNGHLKIKELPTYELGMIDLDNIQSVPEFKKITRKYNYSNNNHNWKDNWKGWPNGGLDADYETEEGPGYKIVNRRRTTTTIPATNEVIDPPAPRRSLPAPNLITVDDDVKRISHYHVLKEYGPFSVGADLIVIVHTKEQFEGAQGKVRYRVLCSPIFLGDQKQYSLPEYNCAKVQFFTGELEEAQKWLDEEFAVAQITNIRYNSKWIDNSDRIAVYVTNLKSISSELASHINTVEGELGD